MMGRAEMGCFKMSPSKLRLYHPPQLSRFRLHLQCSKRYINSDSSDSLTAVTDYVGQVWNFFGNIHTKS